MIWCMRTNVTLNDELLDEAVRLSGNRSRREVLEDALRTYVEVKGAEGRRNSYRQRLAKLDAKLSNLRLRRPPSELLREDRDRG